MNRVNNKSSIFNRLFQKGARVHQRYATLIFENYTSEAPLHACLCYKKTANAVVRNRTRRRLKAIVSESLKEGDWNQNFLIIGKKSADNIDFDLLNKQVLLLLKHVKKKEVLSC